LVSVIVTVVLLNVATIWAMPTDTLRRAFFVLVRAVVAVFAVFACFATLLDLVTGS
jgi:hypothetical protein